MKKWVLMIALLCSSVGCSQQNDTVAGVQQQMNVYVAMAQAKVATYEQQAVQTYNDAKTYVLQKIQMVTGANFNA